MYEVRQNKERVSRTIGAAGGMARQRVIVDKTVNNIEVFQLGKDKHKRLKRERANNILANIEIPSKLVNKKLGSFTLTDINDMLKGANYSATIHFLERISNHDGIARWNSIGVYTGYDLYSFLRRGIIERYIYNGKQEYRLRFVENVFIPLNKKAKKLITITFQ